MNARGAMEMILASIALEYGLIDERVFVALIVMALVTSMLSGPVLQRLMKQPPSMSERLP
jgi:Kef-type K+ transport system membrane component KefB